MEKWLQRLAVTASVPQASPITDELVELARDNLDSFESMPKEEDYERSLI